MGGGTAHIKIVDRSAVVGPAGHGAKKKELLERQLALENVSLRQAKFTLEVERRENLAAGDNFFDVGSMLGDGVDDSVAEGFALIVPGALGEFVRRVLNEAGHHMLAGRCNAWICQAGDYHINVGPTR